MKRIYLAGALFSEAELMYNKKIADRIRNTNKYEVFLPQENEIIGEVLNDKSMQSIFEMDVNEITRCDCVVAIVDGSDIDSGTAWEIGYAYALQKPIIALRTDARTLGGDEMFNLMIQKSVVVVKSIDELIRKLTV